MTVRVPEFLPSNAYTFQSFRYALQQMRDQAGVVTGTDMKVSQHAAGANMTVDIATGNGWINGASIAQQGFYHTFNDATLNVGNFNAADPFNPRIDQVIIAVEDASVAGTNNDGKAVIIQGTAVAGAQAVDPNSAGYRSGAASDASIRASYPNFLRLCDVAVPATATSILNSYIIDRRPWANGASYTYTNQTAGAYSTIAGVYEYVDINNMSVRLETQQPAVEVIFSAATALGATFNGFFQILIDGLAVNSWERDNSGGGLADSNMPITIHTAYGVAAGTHLYQVQFKTSAFGLGFNIGPATFSVREIMTGANSNNGHS